MKGNELLKPVLRSGGPVDGGSVSGVVPISLQRVPGEIHSGSQQPRGDRGGEAVRRKAQGEKCAAGGAKTSGEGNLH